MSLAARTLFMSGGKRAIGLATAPRTAPEGVNIVIAAETADPHPKLARTTYTAVAPIGLREETPCRC